MLFIKQEQWNKNKREEKREEKKSGCISESSCKVSSIHHMHLLHTINAFEVGQVLFYK